MATAKAAAKQQPITNDPADLARGEVIMATGDAPAPAEPAAETERPPLKAIAGLKYRGSGTRILTAKDLCSLGVESPKSEDDLVWAAGADPLPVSGMNADTVDALVKLGEFDVVEA